LHCQPILTVSLRNVPSGNLTNLNTLRFARYTPALSPSRHEAPYEAKFSRLRQNGSKQHFDITQSVNLNVMSELTYVLKSIANLFSSMKACKWAKIRCSLLKQLSQRSNRHHRAYLVYRLYDKRHTTKYLGDKCPRRCVKIFKDNFKDL
jgi:hypothetical protein